MHRTLKALLRTVVAPLGVLVVLLVVVHAIPDDRVADQLVDARGDGEFSSEDWVLTRPANLEDKFADCLGASIGLGEPGTLRSAFLSDGLGKCSVANPLLDEFVRTGTLTSGWQYLRYWHGYAVVTRPLIAVVGLGATRYVLTGAIVAAVALLTALAVRRSKNPAAALVLVPLAATTDLLWMASAVPTAVGMIAALAGPALVLAAPANRTDLLARVFLAGALVSFMDLLSVGPISWSLCVVAVGLRLAPRADPTRAAAKVSAAAAALWVVGYGAMWSLKWILAALFVGVGNVRENVTEGVRFRLNGEHALVKQDFFASSRVNFDYWLEQPFTTELLVFSGCAIVSSLWFSRSNWQRWLANFAFAASPALLIVIWFEVLRNHSQIHRWLTYRFWAVAAGIVVLAAVNAVRLEVAE